MLVSGNATVGHENKAIWTISTVIGQLRPLREDAWDAAVSPDGEKIVFKNRTQSEIWLMGINGENPRRLLSVGKGYVFERLAWAPRGRRLAYMKSTTGFEKVAIESCDLEGKQNFVILSDRKVNDFAWAPDGRILYSLSEDPPNEYDTNLWEIQVNPGDGKVTGKPRRVTQWAGFTLRDLSLCADGKRLAFTNRREQSDVYLGQLEDRGRRLEKVRRLTVDDRIDWPGGWSRDSNSLYFYSDRNGPMNLFRQGIADPSAEAVLSDPDEKGSPRLSPDGAWVLYFTWAKTEGVPPQSGRLMKFPVSSGPPQLVFEAKGYPGSVQFPRQRFSLSSKGFPEFRCASQPGGRCVVAELVDRWLVFSEFDPERGGKTESLRLDRESAVPAAACPDCPAPSPSAGAEQGPGERLDTIFWDLSPDGAQLAYGRRERGGAGFTVVDLATRQARQITVKGWNNLSFLAWSADGKSFFAARASTRGDTLLYVGADGEAQALVKGTRTLQRPTPSPDGRHLAYGEVVSNSNAWIIEGP